MLSVIDRVIGRTDFKRSTPALEADRGTDDFHVVMPDSVDMPLPRAPREEMRIPASINGRDLSTGRL
jgi:hypothetical protein